MRVSRILVALVGVALVGQALGARQLKQVGQYGSYAPSVINSQYAGTTSVGAIDTTFGRDRGGSQAAAYYRGAAGATGNTALGIAVAFEDNRVGSAHAAADLIRRQAGYRGSSIAGDIFLEGRQGLSAGASAAEDAMRRNDVDVGMLRARMESERVRRASLSPFDI